jgi:hypothetical protein
MPHERSGRYATGPGYVDPDRPRLSWIRLVCEPALRRKLVDLSIRRGTSLSEVVREACRRYIHDEEEGRR